MTPLDALRLAPPRATRARVALAWAAATFLALAALAGTPGISRDEGAVLAALDRGAAAAAERGAQAMPASLAAWAAIATDAVFSRIGLSHVRAARLATALFGAGLSAALALLGWDLAGVAVALLAPALFWLAPRQLQAGLVATPDLALAALAAGTVLAYRSAAVDPDARRRVRAALRAGVLFGAALAARSDAWVLLVALVLHAVVARRAPREGAAASPVEGRLRGVPPALVAMVTIGPIIFGAVSPALWTSPLGGIASALVPGWSSTWNGAAAALRPGLPGAHPLVATALTVPATLLWAYLGGAAQAVLRAARGLRRRAPGASDDLLFLLCAAAPFVAAIARLTPPVAGVRAWLHAMPFLALLGARAVVTAAGAAWPARAAPLTASLALLVLYPALRAELHFHPANSSAWNELAGGAPGAAGLGAARQDGGEAAAEVLDQLNARARIGARVWWPDTPRAAVRLWTRDGRLRPDLKVVNDPDSADLAVVTLDGESRDAEYRAWTAFRSARPVAGAYVDEVPLAFVYARPGAWR